jgi:hypothetical protein
MKKVIFTLLSICVISGLSAQTIPNGNFESWSLGSPNGWVTYNSIYFLVGLSAPPAVQLSPAPEGSYAIKLVNEYSTTDSMVFPGFAVLGDMNPLTGSGSIGVPFTDRPGSLDGVFQQHGATLGDTIAISCVLTKWDAATASQLFIGAASFFSQAEVSSWTDFSFPFQYDLPDAPDSMTVYLYSFGGDGSSLSVDNLHFSGTTEVSENAALADVVVFPNPAHEEVFVDCSVFVNQPVQAMVYDIQGNLVYETNWTNGGLKRLNVNDWSKGQYILHLQSGGMTKKKSFIKQ